MWETLQADPEKFGMAIVYCVVALAILGGVAIKAWGRNEASKRDAELKMEMLNKGLSAGDIERILAAKSASKTDLAQTQAYAKK